MNKFYSWPIRVHLTILIALIVVPSISLIIYSGMAQRHEEIAGAKTELLRFVNDIAGQQQTMVAGVKQLGITLSLLPAIRSRNTATVTTLLVDLLRQNPQYTNIIVGDRSGLVWASGVPLKGKLYVGDRRHYQDALRTGMFSSGEYVIGRVTKKPVMIFGYPVKNASNKVIAVIGVTLNLEYTQQVFEKLSFPSGASFSLLDHQGIILVRNLNDPVSEKLVGRRDTMEELFTKMTKGLDEGTYEAMGNDGNPRLVAYKRISLPHESEPYLYVRSSIPLISATSKATAAMFKSLSVFVLLFLIGLFLAWFIGKRIIVNPVIVLKKASEQLAAGADTVNVSHVVTGGELGELARTFDDMAGALVRRETALRESEQRWAITLASIGDAVIATDEAGNITFMNAVAEELTGWTLINASQRPLQEVFRIINEQTRQEVENPAAKALREGTVVGLANHTVLVRKDGAEVPIDDSGAPIRDADGKTLGFVLVFRDITDHKQAEAEEERLLAELAEERTRWQTTVENMLDPVTLCDAEGRATYMNPAYEQLIKRSIAQGLTIEDHPEYYQLYRPDGTLFPAEELPLQKAARTGENVRNVELIQRSANGQEFAAIFSAAPLRNEEGKVTGAVAIGHDMTELKRTEKALKNAYADLEERVKERTYELSEAYEILQREVNERKKWRNTSPGSRNWKHWEPSLAVLPMILTTSLQVLSVLQRWCMKTLFPEVPNIEN
jgi:PAS domain S-box-containing protein